MALLQTNCAAMPENDVCFRKIDDDIINPIGI
jgi:hypothetical protein